MGRTRWHRTVRERRGYPMRISYAVGMPGASVQDRERLLGSGSVVFAGENASAILGIR